MRRLIAIICLLIWTTSLGAQTTYERYVDTGATGLANGEDWTNAWTTLAAGVAAMDGVAVTGDTVNFHLRRTGAGDVDTAPVSFTAANWAAGVTITVTGEDFPSDGVWDESAYILRVTSVSNGASLTTTMPITLTHIQVENVCSSAYAVISGILVNGADSCVIDSCLIRGNQTHTGTGKGIYVYYADNCVIRNCIVYNWINGADDGFSGIFALGEAGDDVYVYQCTVSNNYRGLVEAGSGSIVATNCAIFDHTDDVYGNTVMTNCAIDDSDKFTGKVDISPGATEADDWAAAFTDYANGDFSVKAADSVLYDAGADLSGTVDDDIIGTARPQDGDYDIGAFELQTALPKAADLIPADWVVDLALDTVLVWDTVSGALNYNVYLAPYDSDLVLVANVDPNTYDPDLSYSTLYKWRVDPNNAVGATTGDVQVFRTTHGPDDVTPSPGQGPIFGGRIFK